MGKSEVIVGFRISGGDRHKGSTPVGVFSHLGFEGLGIGERMWAGVAMCEEPPQLKTTETRRPRN